MSMSKKTFIEEELAREAKLRSKSQKLSLRQRLEQFLHKGRVNVSSNQENTVEHASTSLRLTDMYTRIVSPNDMRKIYEYPTLSDRPQQAGVVVMTKLNSTDGDNIEVPLYFCNEKGY